MSRYPNGNLTNIYIKLSEPIKFVHNGQRRIHGLSPWVFEVFDIERIPGPHERKGQFKGRQTWYAQAVEMCRLEPRSRYIEIALVRGLRISGGSLEDTFAALTAHVKEATQEVADLFPNKYPVMCEIRNKMNWYSPAAHIVDQRMSGASEVYVQLSILDQGDDLEYASQLKLALLKGDSFHLANRQGVNLLFCASSVTRQFTSNYPAHFVDVHAGAISVITCVKSSIDVAGVHQALIYAGVEWRKILRVAFHRQQPFIQETGARIPMILEDGRIDHVLSDICIIYWHETGQLIQEPGEIPEDALQMICEVNAHGDPHGSHSTYSLLEPGLELKRSENNVMVKIEHGKGSKPFFPKSAALLKKNLPSGDTQIGGLTLKKYAAHTDSTPPNTPGSNTSTPLRTPSAYTGNRSNAASGGGGGPTQAAMAGWHSPPPPRGGGAKEIFSEKRSTTVTHIQSEPKSSMVFPPLNSTRIATVYDEKGRSQVIATRQTASAVAAPGTFSMDALHKIIQGEREHTQSLVAASTQPLLAQIAALTAQTAQAKEETARTLRDFQLAQDRNTTTAIQSGFAQMLNSPLFQSLATLMNQQQQAGSPAPAKDEDEA